MTDSQRESAELLRDLGRPASVIAANLGWSIDVAKDWLRTGRGPKSSLAQRSLFDAGGSPRETAKPAIAGRNHGLRIFANPTGKSDVTSEPWTGITE